MTSPRTGYVRGVGRTSSADGRRRGVAGGATTLLFSFPGLLLRAQRDRFGVDGGEVRPDGVGILGFCALALLTLSFLRGFLCMGLGLGLGVRLEMSFE